MPRPAYSHPKPAPRSVDAAVETVLAARGRAQNLKAVIDRSPVPMVLVDNWRRYVEVNRPARLLFRLSLTQVGHTRVDDLVPPDGLPRMLAAWEQVLETGSVTGTRELTGPVGSRLHIVYYGLANALPGRHVGVFAPASWTEDEFGVVRDGAARSPGALSPREREILQLAAEGLSTPALAERLELAPATVKTHLGHIYEKLDAAGRTAAVAKAMRLGFIV
jgi:DNA-binding CsgD family transcriptional regulator